MNYINSVWLNNNILLLLFIIVVVLILFFCCCLLIIILVRIRKKTTDLELLKIKETAVREAEQIVEKSKILAKVNVVELREKFESEVKNRRHGFENFEKRLFNKEEILNKRLDSLNSKYDFLDKKEKEINELKNVVTQKIKIFDDKIDKQIEQLQTIAHLTKEDAKKMLLKRLEDNLIDESGILIKNYLEKVQETVKEKSQKIISVAIQRYSSDFVNEKVAFVIPLPNDEMKGRIIGREGRNIRSIEAVLGVNILVDDTPESIVISCFDPIRREIGRQVMEKLILDGRIHPARIEEIAKKVKDNLEKEIITIGNDTVLKIGLRNVSQQVIKLIGRLKYRYSFSQNVLEHSIETSYFMGMIAVELELNENKAKRIGLLHDIGKAIDHEIEGTHAAIGADILSKNNEDIDTINAVASHHNEIEPNNVYSILVNACDALSASRPGARSESTELYLKRLRKLESIGIEFKGVDNCFAFQAGRELRVIVSPKKITDEGAYSIARDICLKIEKEVNYPGKIQVTVVRETRCISYAK